MHEKHSVPVLFLIPLFSFNLLIKYKMMINIYDVKYMMMINIYDVKYMMMINIYDVIPYIYHLNLIVIFLSKFIYVSFNFSF